MKQRMGVVLTSSHFDVALKYGACRMTLTLSLDIFEFKDEGKYAKLMSRRNRA